MHFIPFLLLLLGFKGVSSHSYKNGLLWLLQLYVCISRAFRVDLLFLFFPLSLLRDCVCLSCLHGVSLLSQTCRHRHEECLHDVGEHVQKI